MRIVFAGTPVFSAQALSALLAAGHQIALVLTQPDRPAGRGLSMQPSPVKRLALEHGLALYQPVSLKSPEAGQILSETRPDVMVVAAYGLILPQAVLDIPRHGCLNIHASLLPRWRGAAPIQRALLAGDAQSGVTIMRMEAGLDSGPMLLTQSVPIEKTDTAASLHDKLAALGAHLIVEALTAVEQNRLTETRQAEEGVTYASKLQKAEATLDWRCTAAELDRAIRAFNPFPGATARLNGQDIKIWSANIGSAIGTPGSVLNAGKSGIEVACGEGALRLTELQKAGGKRLPVADFLGGFAIQPGQRFALPTD